MPTIDEVWSRLRALEGKTFRQLRGGEFQYSLEGSVLRPSRTNRALSKGQIAKALARLPLSRPSQFHDLQGPSYIYALLSDQRVRRLDW